MRRPARKLARRSRGPARRRSHPGSERLPHRQTRRTRPSVPVTFAAATPTAGSPPPPANSIVLAVGEAATAASQSQLERDDAIRQATQPADLTPGGHHCRTRGTPEQEVERVGCAQPCDRGHEKERRRRLARQGNQISTPFVTLPGLVSGECASQGGFNYLSVTVNADPSDPRADDIGGGGDLTPSGACTSTYRSSWATSSSGWRTRRRRTRVERRRAVRLCVTCSMPMPRAWSRPTAVTSTRGNVNAARCRGPRRGNRRRAERSRRCRCSCRPARRTGSAAHARSAHPLSWPSRIRSAGGQR